MSKRVKSEADTCQNNRTNFAASNPHERTVAGQQYFAPRSSIDDAKDSERINQTLISSNQHSLKNETAEERSDEKQKISNTGQQRSNHESTIKLYRSSIRNETERMMISIDIVESEAKYLFGLERSRIFFDLLDDGLFHFGPAGDISNFVPNIAESTVRQHVISFFEHMCDLMNRLMTLLLGCPKSKRLQQMPEENFISLMQSVIDSALKTKIKGGKKLSLKGSTLIMADLEEFERALGEEITEDVSDRFRHGEEMVAHRFDDTRLEGTQTSERREKMLIQRIYFPSDCRLFIHVPTNIGNYWHQLDMQRSNRTSQRGCMGNTNCYKAPWKKFKKQAKKFATSNADTDNSNDESMSDKKQKISQPVQKKKLDTHARERPYSARNKLKQFASEECLTFASSEGVQVKIDNCERALYGKKAPTTYVFSHGSSQNQNRNKEVKEDTQRHEENIKEEEETGNKFEGNWESLPTSEQLDLINTKEQIQNKINILPDEMRRKFINRSKSIHPEDILAQFKLLDDITTTPNNIGQDSVEINILPEEVRRKFINGSKSIHPEDSLAPFNLLVDITTTSGKIGEKLVEVKNVAAEKRSKQESTMIKLYRKVIRNETFRMMTSFDMVVSEAQHLFGVERAQIFFDLLADKLFHFGPAGDISHFVPNMVESIVRQNVISFFEHSHDVMNQLMTLFVGCPDSKRFHQMSDENFISLIQSVIDSSLKTKTKGGKKQSSEESTFTLVDSKEFERALGEEIPGEVLDRLRHGDEVIAHILVDTQASERKENRFIHSIFLPSDCRLFIYIPIENGSYWHQRDMPVGYVDMIDNCSIVSSN